MRTPYQPRNVRNLLCIFARYTPSFGTFHHAYPLLRSVRAFMRYAPGRVVTAVNADA